MSGQARFGPFALRLETADLEVDGTTVRLPEQQFQILLLLLKKSGGVVSREEIRRALWPNDTIVEYDRSINTAILKLRSALEDLGGQEPWIETIPRRGYRLQATAQMPALVMPAPKAESSATQIRQGSLVGQRVSHYRVLEVLGGGGMSVVYKGEDLKLDRPVALKFLAEELGRQPEVLKRLEREARTASSLNHPNICTIYEIGEHEQRPFLVMEYLEGETLRSIIEKQKIVPAGGSHPLPPEKLLNYGIQMARGLAAAHSLGIIHRDIKPANIYVTKAGTVKLLDFGVALQSIPGPLEDAPFSPSSKTGPGSGTFDYMSPEQATGELTDQRSDLFSLGIVLAEMFTGVHPFRNEDDDKPDLATSHDLPRLSGDLPQNLLVLIRRLLSRSLELRYQSIDEVIADLERISRALLDGERAGIASEIPLIGREQEFARLKGLLSQAIAGQGSMVMIGGEPGIGKSHLARALVEEARRRGALGAIGHCYEMEGAPPYAPFLEMLDYILRMAPRESLRHSLGDHASEVARLFPELREMYPEIPPPIQLPPEQQRRYLFNAFRSFVERAACTTPLVVVFEDLHWADETTLQLLHHHAQSLSTTPMLVICTYRDMELDATHPFARTLETLMRKKLAARLPLRRLPMGEVGEMLAALSGQTPPAFLVHVIFEETEGNPFFVEEVFRHLAEEGRLFDPTGKWLPDIRIERLQVPESVRLVLGRRLGRLSETTRRVLTTAAVIGRSFSLRLLEQFENQEPDGAIEAIEEAERAHLVAPEPEGREVRYRFVHELVRQTLAESLSLPRRQRLHFRIAEAIEKVYADRLGSQASQLAHHLYQAGAAADPEKTTSYLILAARQARARSAHEEALGHLDLALSLREDAPDLQSAELLEQKGSILRSLGRPDEAVDVYRKAIGIFERAGASNKLAEASIALAYLQAWRHDPEGANQTMERAYEAVHGQDARVVSSVLSMRAAIMSATGEPAIAQEMFEKARSLRIPGSISAQEPHNMLEGIHYYQSFQLEKVRSTCQRVAEECLVRGDVWSASSLEFYGVWAEMYCGRPESGSAMVSAAMQRAEKIGHHGAIWALKIAGSIASAAKGNLDAARRETMEASEFGSAHDVGWNFATSLQLGHFALWSGNLREAENLYNRGINVKEKSYLSDLAEACLFAAWAEFGDHRALSVWKNRAWNLPKPGQLNSLGSWNALERTVIGLAHLKQWEDLAGLRQLTEELLLTGAWNYTILFPFHTVAGITAAAAGDWEAAERHHSAAVRQTDIAPYKHLQPVSREWYAEMLMKRNRPGDEELARDLIEEALRMHEEAGWPTRGKHARLLIKEL